MVDSRFEISERCRAARHAAALRSRSLHGLVLALLCLCAGCPPNMKCLSGFPGELCPVGSAATGFLDFPWPNDVRKTAGGTLDLSGFPNGGAPCVPGSLNTCLKDILDRGSAVTREFGTNSAVFFTISATVDTSSLPATAQASLASGSSVALVNLDTGARIPVQVDYKAEASPRGFRPAHTLAILPYPGHPLAEGARHAAILFGGASGIRTITVPGVTAPEPMQPAPMIAALDAQPSTAAPISVALKQQLAAVRAYAGARAADITGFTVFTTQSPSRVSRAIKATLDALPAVSFAKPSSASPATGCAAGGSRVVLEGRMDIPRFQPKLESPYLQSGGAITLINTDEGERAQIQFEDPVDYQLVVPCAARDAMTMPDGWPVLVVVGFTGSGFRNAVDYADRFYGAGGAPNYVVLSIAPYFSGERLPPEARAVEILDLPDPLPDINLAGLTFFNFVNPLAGRNNQRQQGAEIAYLARFAQELALAATDYGGSEPLITDDAKIAFYGHSQGAVPGPIGLAMTDRYRGAFLNAPGGGLYHTIVYRGNVRAAIDFLLGGLLTPLPGNELDEFHPVAHVLQTLSEDGDASNYADDMFPTQMVMTGGAEDGCSIFEGVAHVASAAGMWNTQYDAPQDPIYAIETLSGRAKLGLPTAPAFLPGGVKGVVLRLPSGHMVVRNNQELVRNFFDNLFTGGGAIIYDNPNPRPQNERSGCDRARLFEPPLPISPLVRGPAP
jgi:hypothetical protein